MIEIKWSQLSWRLDKCSGFSINIIEVITKYYRALKVLSLDEYFMEEHIENWVTGASFEMEKILYIPPSLKRTHDVVIVDNVEICFKFPMIRLLVDKWSSYLTNWNSSSLLVSWTWQSFSCLEKLTNVNTLQDIKQLSQSGRNSPSVGEAVHGRHRIRVEDILRGRRQDLLFDWGAFHSHPQCQHERHLSKLCGLPAIIESHNFHRHYHS